MVIKDVFFEFDKLFDKYKNRDNLMRTIPEIGEKGTVIIRDMDEFPACTICDESESKLIVSLTTIPERIQSVDIPIKCMLLQTKPINKIVLWLDKERFSGESIPEQLYSLQANGLEIRFVKDVGPHTKYFYALREFENDFIVTIDDDIVYPRNLIEELWETHEYYPKSVCGAWIWNMRVSKNGVPYPTAEYNDVDFENSANSSKTYIAQGVGGVLYPPRCVDKRYLNDEVIAAICPKADDVYLKAIEILSGIEVVKIKSKQMIYGIIPDTQKRALYKFNQNGGNDSAVVSVFNHFSLYSYFANEKKEENRKLPLLSKWIVLYQNGVHIKDYLIARNIQAVAIYGLGQIGNMLLSELTLTSVYVKYGIDRRKDSLNSSIPVYKLEDELENVELIIYTASSDFDHISKEIRSRIACCIISLEDILAELLWEHCLL